jgi:hypothetical protein
MPDSYYDRRLTRRLEDPEFRDAYNRELAAERKFCGYFIEVAGDPYAGTYCKLLAGHDGAHSAHYPAEPEPEAGADYSPHSNVGRLS